MILRKWYLSLSQTNNSDSNFCEYIISMRLLTALFNNDQQRICKVFNKTQLISLHFKIISLIFQSLVHHKF